MKRLMHIGLLLIVLSVLGYSGAMKVSSSRAIDTSNNWTTETIAVTDRSWRGRYSHTAIAVDDQGQPHISGRGTSNSLRYATRTGGEWLIDVVDDPPVSVARESDITLNVAGEPLISFSDRDGNNENLKLAQHISGSWRVDVLDALGSVGMENSIALDQQGHVHIAHFEWSGARLKYTTNKNGAWETNVLVDTDVAQDRIAIAVDSLGRVHIIYSSLSGVLVHLAYVDGVWERSGIVRCGQTSCGVALAIDATDHLHIVYALQDSLMYATDRSALIYPFSGQKKAG